MKKKKSILLLSLLLMFLTTSCFENSTNPTGFNQNPLLSNQANPEQLNYNLVGNEGSNTSINELNSDSLEENNYNNAGISPMDEDNLDNPGKNEVKNNDNQSINQTDNNNALSRYSQSIDESISIYLDQELFNDLIESDSSVVKLKQDLENSFQSRATNLSTNNEYVSSTLKYIDNISIRAIQLDAALQATKKLENTFKARSKLSINENKQVVANLLGMINKNQEELKELFGDGSIHYALYVHVQRFERNIELYNKLQRLKIIIFTIIDNKFSEYENLLNLQENYLLNLAKDINKHKINTLIPFYKAPNSYIYPMPGIIASAYINDNKVAGDLSSELEAKVLNLKNEINLNSSTITVDPLLAKVNEIKTKIRAAQKESADTQKNINYEYTMNVLNHPEINALGSSRDKEKYPTYSDYWSVYQQFLSKLEAQSKVPALKLKISELKVEIESLREQELELASQANQAIRASSNSNLNNSEKIKSLGKEIVDFLNVKYSEIEKKSISYRSLDVENLNNIIDNVEHRAIVHKDVNPIGRVDYKKIQRNYIRHVIENKAMDTYAWTENKYDYEQMKYLFLTSTVPENSTCKNGYGASVVTHGKIPVYWTEFNSKDYNKYSVLSTNGKTMSFVNDNIRQNDSFLFHEKKDSYENSVFHKYKNYYLLNYPRVLGSSVINIIKLYNNLLDKENKQKINYEFIVDSDEIIKSSEISLIDFENDQFFDLDKDERSIGDVTWVDKGESFLLRSSISSTIDPVELEDDHDPKIDINAKYYLSYYKKNSRGQYSRIDRVEIASKKSLAAKFEIQYSEESKNAIIKIKHLIHRTPTHSSIGAYALSFIKDMNGYKKVAEDEYEYVINHDVVQSYTKLENNYLKGLTLSIDELNNKYRDGKMIFSIVRSFDDYNISEIKVTSDGLQTIKSDDYNFYQGIVFDYSKGTFKTVIAEHEEHFSDVENKIIDMESSYKQLLEKNGLDENNPTEEAETISDSLYVELMNKYFPYYMSKYGYTKYNKENKVKVENIASGKYLFIDDQKLSRFVYTCN